MQFWHKLLCFAVIVLHVLRLDRQIFAMLKKNEGLGGGGVRGGGLGAEHVFNNENKLDRG